MKEQIKTCVSTSKEVFALTYILGGTATIMLFGFASMLFNPMM